MLAHSFTPDASSSQMFNRGEFTTIVNIVSSLSSRRHWKMARIHNSLQWTTSDWCRRFIWKLQYQIASPANEHPWYGMYHWNSLVGEGVSCIGETRSVISISNFERNWRSAAFSASKPSNANIFPLFVLVVIYSLPFIDASFIPAPCNSLFGFGCFLILLLKSMQNNYVP